MVSKRFPVTAVKFMLVVLLSNVSHIAHSQQIRRTPLMSGRSVGMGSIG